jgi:starvation-inducible DNA-binding protein
MTLNIGLTKEQLDGSVTILNKLLADEFALYTKTRKYHWNVTGPQFHDLHKFLESLYDELDEIIDEVAERTRALGAFPIATLREISSTTTIKEEAGENPKHPEMIQTLLANHEQIIRELRLNVDKTQDDFGDAGTADFLTGLMEKHEKTAWMLRSMLV